MPLRSLSSGASRVTYPGVDEAVRNVDEEVGRDQKGPEEDREAKDERVVEILHGYNEVPAEAGYGKDALNHERARQHSGDRRSENRQDREQGIAHLVPP